MTIHGIPPLYPAAPDAAAAAADAASASVAESGTFASSFGTALAAASDALERASASEQRFATGRGDLQQMVLDRAQADVALSLAGATASRATQALSTILAMQI